MALRLRGARRRRRSSPRLRSGSPSCMVWKFVLALDAGRDRRDAAPRRSSRSRTSSTTSSGRVLFPLRHCSTQRIDREDRSGDEDEEADRRRSAGVHRRRRRRGNPRGRRKGKLHPVDRRLRRPRGARADDAAHRRRWRSTRSVRSRSWRGSSASRSTRASRSITTASTRSPASSTSRISSTPC